MFLVEHPLTALIISLGILMFFKSLFALSNILEKMNANKKKSKDNKKEEKSESVKTASDEKQQEKVEAKTSSSGGQKNSGETNYLYDRFVVSPTIDDPKTCADKISDAFLSPADAKNIKDKKVDIRVEPVDLQKEKSSRVYEILQKYEDKQKLIEEFSSMPKEMKILLIENIISKLWFSDVYAKC